MLRRVVLFAALLLGIVSWAAASSAVTIPPSMVEISADLGNIQIVPGLNASVDPQTGKVLLPVTNVGTLTVEHEFSTIGLELGSTRVAFEDLVVDFGSLMVFGVAGWLENRQEQFLELDVPLFNLFPIAGEGPGHFELVLKEQTASLLNQAFGTSFQTGDDLGKLWIDQAAIPPSVPEPGVVLLMGAGLLGLWRHGRRPQAH